MRSFLQWFLPYDWALVCATCLTMASVRWVHNKLHSATVPLVVTGWILTFWWEIVWSVFGRMHNLSQKNQV